MFYTFTVDNTQEHLNDYINPNLPELRNDSTIVCNSFEMNSGIHNIKFSLMLKPNYVIHFHRRAF